MPLRKNRDDPKRNRHRVRRFTCFHSFCESAPIPTQASRPQQRCCRRQFDGVERGFEASFAFALRVCVEKSHNSVKSTAHSDTKISVFISSAPFP
jgi:hypothetical protein